MLVPPHVHNDIPIEKPPLDEYELPSNANYPVGPEPVIPVPLSLPGKDYLVYYSIMCYSKESPPPGYLSDDTSGIENSPGACSVLGGGSSGMTWLPFVCSCLSSCFVLVGSPIMSPASTLGKNRCVMS